MKVFNCCVVICDEIVEDLLLYVDWLCLMVVDIGYLIVEVLDCDEVVVFEGG